MSLKTKFEELRQAIKNINRYQPQWELLEPGTGTDPLGDFEIVENSNINNILPDDQINVRAGYYRLIDGVHIRIVIPHVGGPIGEIGALDFSAMHTISAESFLKYGSSVISNESLITQYVKRLILPNHAILLTRFLESTQHMYGGLYLPRTGVNSSDWIGDTTSHTIPVKCPKDANIPYYLNKISISAEDMVNIFNNMIDRSSEGTVKYITLGSTNLAKLTEEQKQIAYKKGWDLQ